MTALQSFNDFMNSTGPSFLTGPDRIVNEAVQQNYLWGELVRNNAEAIQGGDQIRETLMFDEQNSFRFYNPNATFTYKNPQVQKNIRAPWRFAVDEMVWTDQEIELNAGDGQSREALKVVYKRIKRSKEQRLATSIVNGLENTLTLAPNSGEMEDLDGTQVYSIPVFVHDNVGSNAGDTPAAARPAHNWSGAIHGVDPNTEERWRNPVSFYAEGATANASAAEQAYTADTINGTVPVRGLITAMDDMWLRVMFRPPANMGDYFENDTMRRQKIVTSRKGMNLYKRALRDANDSLVTPQDSAYTQPAFSGIPITYMSQLDSAAIYPADAGATVAATVAGANAATVDSYNTEDDAATVFKGARFYFLNAEYLHPFIHSRRYLVKHPVMKHPNQPFTHVQVTDCWWNLIASSRQRHGVVAPAYIAN